MTHISIIIIHYNNKKQTTTCLKSLTDLKTSGFKYRVVVIDNGSQERFTLPEALSPQLFEVVRSEANLGFTGGNNLAIKYAIEKYNSDYVVLLNNDTVVEPQFLKHLYEAQLANPRAGVLCPLIYFMPNQEYHSDSYRQSERGKVLWFGGGSIDWNHLAAFHRGVDEVDRAHFDTVQKMDFATGCCMFISREVLEKSGTFDERYFLYLEDVDLSLRIKKKGYDLLFCPKAKIWHENAGSSGGPGYSIQNYYLTRNRLLFALLHGNLKQQYIAVRLLLQYLYKGNEYQRRAVLHLLTLQLGKQPLA